MGKKFYLVVRCKKTLVGFGDGPLGVPDPLLDPSYKPTFANSVQLSCNITARPKLPWISGQSPESSHIFSVHIGWCPYKLGSIVLIPRGEDTKTFVIIITYYTKYGWLRKFYFNIRIALKNFPKTCLKNIFIFVLSIMS